MPRGFLQAFSQYCIINRAGKLVALMEEDHRLQTRRTRSDVECFHGRNQLGEDIPQLQKGCLHAGVLGDFSKRLQQFLERKKGKLTHDVQKAITLPHPLTYRRRHTVKSSLHSFNHLVAHLGVAASFSLGCVGIHGALQHRLYIRRFQRQQKREERRPLASAGPSHRPGEELRAVPELDQLIVRCAGQCPGLKVDEPGKVITNRRSKTPQEQGMDKLLACIAGNDALNKDD